ncbi:MAG: hypothetical protein DF280_02155 ['Brassica napus' phytoplasma]|nr:MAG: hypothetical protein DF280_02155 ['Brassica napus' phytoplasma]
MALFFLVYFINANKYKNRKKNIFILRMVFFFVNGIKKAFGKLKKKYGHFGFKVIFYDGTYEDLISNNKEIIYISDNKILFILVGFICNLKKILITPHFLYFIIGKNNFMIKKI